MLAPLPGVVLHVSALGTKGHLNVKHLDKALIASGAALLLSGGIAAAALGPSNVGSAVMASLPGDVALAVQGNNIGGVGNWLTTAATYIGITEAALRTELATGKSLADVAVAHGKTRDGVIAALTAAATTGITTLVDTKNPLPARGAGGPGAGGRGTAGDVDIDQDEISVAVTYLGATEADLQTKLQAGQTLAQIAAGTNGKSRDGLIQALVADANTRIDAAAAAGKITAAQATTAKTNATALATAFVDNTRPAGGPGFGGPGGRGHR
jgi:hypothetical protein